VASTSGGDINLSFPIKVGFGNQMQYKDNLTDTNWPSLGAPISGNGAMQSVNPASTGNSRFYSLQIEQIQWDASLFQL
jgi:hypothetical protein